MRKLTDSELKSAVAAATGWAYEGGKLRRTWSFSDFKAAMSFVNQVATTAEAAGHHPDIDIRYNRVTLALVTHDVGGITENDASMASSLSRLFPPV